MINPETLKTVTQIRLGLEPSGVVGNDGGFYVDTRAFPEKKFEEDLRLAWAGASSFVSAETARSYFNSKIPYSRGRETWTQTYATLVEKQGRDIAEARAKDGQTHSDQVNVIGKNSYFPSLQFFRDIFNSQERRPGTIVSLKSAGLVALTRSLDQNLPDSERLEFEFLGVSLLIKARRVDVETHPRAVDQDSSIVYYLKQQYTERDEAEKRKRRFRRKEEAEKGKRNPKIDLRQESSWGKIGFYADRIAEWTLRYEEEAAEEYALWETQFRKRYEPLVRAARLQRFKPYDAPRSRKFELYDYDKMQEDPEHDPLFVGLVMLRTAPKKPERTFREYEERGFESLVFEFNHPDEMFKDKEAKRKWKAYVAFVIKQEYLHKKSLLERKGHTVRKEMADEIGRAHARTANKAEVHIPLGI